MNKATTLYQEAIVRRLTNQTNPALVKVTTYRVSDKNSQHIKFTRLPCNDVCIESIRNGVTIINFLSAEAWEALKTRI